MNDEFDDLMDEVIENIHDRKAAREFLNELANQIAQNAENNRALSLLLLSILKPCSVPTSNWWRFSASKKGENRRSGLSDEDKASLFDMIQGETWWLKNNRFLKFYYRRSSKAVRKLIRKGLKYDAMETKQI